jgi:hypothetical protein
MNSSNAYIIEMLYIVAHDLSGHERLLGDGNITRTGRNDGDNAFAVFLSIAPKDDGSRKLAIFCFRDRLLYRGKLIWSGSRGQKIAAVARKAREDLRHVRRSLPLSKHDLGDAHPKHPMVIHFSEAQVFEGKMTQARDSIVWRQLSLAHLLK